MNSTTDGTIARLRNRPKVKRTLEVGREVVADLKRDDVPGLGAEIAYHAIFAIPPLIILIVTIAAAINQFTGYELASRLTQVIEERAPDEIRELLLTLVDHAIANVNGGLASLGVLTALVPGDLVRLERYQRADQGLQSSLWRHRGSQLAQAEIVVNWIDRAGRRAGELRVLPARVW